MVPAGKRTVFLLITLIPNPRQLCSPPLLGIVVLRSPAAELYSNGRLPVRSRGERRLTDLSRLRFVSVHRRPAGASERDASTDLSHTLKSLWGRPVDSVGPVIGWGSVPVFLMGLLSTRRSAAVSDSLVSAPPATGRATL